MSSKDDVESGERKPLLSKVGTKQRNEIHELEEVGEVTSAFATSIQLAVRTAVWMSLMASIIWVPAIRKPFPDQIQARIPLVICLFVFTVNPLMGNAVANGCAGILGTFWACLHMWVMNGIYPGGMKEGMSPTSATAIFGWVNFLAFTLFFLFIKCGMGMKMFALATDIGFMLCFLDPASTVPFSENFTIQAHGTAVNTLLATAIACFAAPILNLIPYPLFSAYAVMKTNAVKASKDTGKLFTAVIRYYNESEASVVIESEIKHSADLRAELDGMGGAIGAAWFERFDMGTAGTVRCLMEGHLGLMNTVYDRLRALIMVAATEDFGASHNKIMDGIHESSMAVARATQKLMLAVTEAATDGDISSSEKSQLQGLIADAKKAIKQLAVDFDKVRRSFPSISQDILGESYFVLTISAYARLVIEYSEMMITNPPTGVGLGAGLSAGISSTFSGLGDKFNVNFTIKHYIALLICMTWSVGVDNWGGGCVITAVFLMSTAICPDIQAFLNVINAVIVAVVVGTLVFQGTCSTGYGTYLLPLASVVIWIGGLYGYFAGGPLLLPCVVVVALSPFKWVAICPEGDIAAGARGLWAGLVSNILAIIFVCACQLACAIDRASNLAVSSLDEAFNGVETAFNSFWGHKDASEPMGGVSGALGAGSGYNASAKIEGRFWRCDWKSGLYSETVTGVQQLRLDILMLAYAVAGSDGQPDGIFSKLESKPEFAEVKDDLNTTLQDAHKLVIDILSHEGGKFTGLRNLKTTTGIDTLDALPPLIEKMKELKFPAKVGDTMEDDELCQLSTAFLMLDTTIKHIAVILQSSIRQA